MNILVGNYTEFKNAITFMTTDTTIVLTDDIIMTGGIQVPLIALNLIIDGRNPVTNEIHMITDYNSSSYTNTIYINPTPLFISITIKNVILHIRNYYSLICVYDSSQCINISIIYDNVDFSGTQAIYNRYGKTYIKDSNFILDTLYGTVCATQEFIEGNYIELSGEINVSHTSNANSCIWIVGNNPALIIKENSNVIFNIINRELLYCDSIPNIFFESNSYTYITTAKGLFYSTGAHRANKIDINSNSNLIIKQTQNNSGVATIRTNGDINLYESATLNIYKSVTTTDPLIEFVNNSTFNVNDVKSLILYNLRGKTIKWTNGSGEMNISGGQANIWSKAAPLLSAGTVKDIPEYSFKKEDESNINANITVLNSQTNLIDSNIILNIDSIYEMNPTTFDITNSSVLSIGKMSLVVNEIKDNSENINGITEPKFDILANYLTNEYENVSDDFGNFIVNVSKMSKNDYIIVSAGKDFLHITKTFIVNGSLTITVPQYLKFIPRAVPIQDEYLYKADNNWQIIVTDTRDNGDDWILYCRLEEALTNNIDNFLDAIIFKDKDIEHVMTPMYFEIYKGLANDKEETKTFISWSKIEGILIKLLSNYGYIDGKYVGKINFILK